METPIAPVTAQAVTSDSAPEQAEKMESASNYEGMKIDSLENSPEVNTEINIDPEQQPVTPIEEEQQTEIPSEPKENELKGSDPAGDEQKVPLSELIKIRKRAQEAEKRAAYLEGRYEGSQQKEPKEEVPNANKIEALIPAFTPLEDYNGSYEEWLSAKVSHDTKHTIRIENEQAAIASRNSSVEKNYRDRFTEAAKIIPDIAETVNNAELPIFDNRVVNAVKKSEIGPQIVYFLAKNQVEAIKLANMDPELAIMELGSIRNRINESTKPLETRKVTGAPPPINPGNSKGTTVSVDLADKDVKSYFETRNKERRARSSG
jgi:hypothetical protein